MPNPETPVLIIREGELAGQYLALTAEVVTVGRGADCDIVLPERQVSRHHFRIHHQDSGYYLEDLNSKNGTFVNGQSVRDSTVHLQDGDEIQVALAVRLMFVGSEATLPLGPGFPLPPAQAAHLEIDPRTRTVQFRNQVLDPPLSAPQSRLLEKLLAANGQVVNREEIVDWVWPEAAGGVSEQAIDALVRRLRERLAELDPNRLHIVTVRGQGFRLVTEP